MTEGLREIKLITALPSQCRKLLIIIVEQGWFGRSLSLIQMFIKHTSCKQLHASSHCLFTRPAYPVTAEVGRFRSFPVTRSLLRGMHRSDLRDWFTVLSSPDYAIDLAAPHAAPDVSSAWSQRLWSEKPTPQIGQAMKWLRSHHTHLHMCQCPVHNKNTERSTHCLMKPFTFLHSLQTEVTGWLAKMLPRFAHFKWIAALWLLIRLGCTDLI